MLSASDKKMILRLLDVLREGLTDSLDWRLRQWHSSGSPTRPISFLVHLLLTLASLLLGAGSGGSSILVSLASSRVSWDVQTPPLGGRRAVLVFIWVVINPVPIVLLSEAKAASVDQRDRVVDIHIKGIRRRSESEGVQ